jgi:hypothetical protein
VASSRASGGRHRYVVERSLAWLVGYRRLQVRYERRPDVRLGFVHLACPLICLKQLKAAGDITSPYRPNRSATAASAISNAAASPATPCAPAAPKASSTTCRSCWR